MSQITDPNLTPKTRIIAKLKRKIK